MSKNAENIYREKEYLKNEKSAQYFSLCNIYTNPHFQRSFAQTKHSFLHTLCLPPTIPFAIAC